MGAGSYKLTLQGWDPVCHLTEGFCPLLLTLSSHQRSRGEHSSPLR